jgi:hypothetical protein
VWATIIAASQLLDALKDVFPMARLHKSAIEHSMTLSILFVDTELEWESIFSGKYTSDEMMDRLHKLKRVQLEAERRSFPDGIAIDQELKSRAEQACLEYFEGALYNAERGEDV